MVKQPIKKSGDSAKTSTASKTATRTATATKTSTEAYTQGNVTVTGGAGAGDTSVTIRLPGGSLANKGSKTDVAQPKAKSAYSTKDRNGLAVLSKKHKRKRSEEE